MSMSHHTPPPWFTCKQLRHRPVLDAVAVAAYLPSRRWTEPAQSLAYPSEECPSFLRTPSRTFVSDRSYHHQQQRSTTTERPRLSLDGGSVRSFDRSFVRAKATRAAPHPFFLPKALCCRPQISRPAVTLSLSLILLLQHERRNNQTETVGLCRAQGKALCQGMSLARFDQDIDVLTGTTVTKRRSRQGRIR
jgi:hypothetical protein